VSTHVVIDSVTRSWPSLFLPFECLDQILHRWFRLCSYVETEQDRSTTLRVIHISSDLVLKKVLSDDIHCTGKNRVTTVTIVHI
jgi:hypothetical protein